MRKLELGSGFHPTPGFEHLDLNPNAPDLDHWHNAATMLPFLDETFVELRVTDLWEHLSHQDTQRALTDWARVLMPGGRIYLQVPDADLIMRWYVQGDARLCTKEGRPCSLREGAEWRLFGGHDDGTYVEEGGDWRLNCHAAMFTKEYVAECCDRAGLDVESIQVNSHPNILVWAVKR